MNTHMFLIVLFFFLPTLTYAATVGVAKTGQTVCYDTQGTAIACTGTGQDGEIRAGAAWPNPRFTDNGNRTVTDNQTGLVWSKNADPAGATQTWQGALDYIKTLNSSNYLGYNDWRLPNRNELASLVDSSQYGPALPSGHPFTNGNTFDSYWSSSTSIRGLAGAWTVSMYNGYVHSYIKTNSRYVWPVRGGQTGTSGSLMIYKTGQTACYILADCLGTGQDGEIQAGAAWPNPRFTDNGNQTVTDDMTGLVWSKNANPADATKTWQDALDYIKTLNSSNYLGYNDWRLPNRNELTSLIDSSQYRPPLPSGHPFANVASSLSYWSSSTSVYDTYGVWTVYMDDGSVNYSNKLNTSYVWPVRGGQIGPWTIFKSDFNTDGKTDLIWRQASTGYQVIALMNGATIISQTDLGGNTDWSVIASGDFNGDGKTDLIWRQASTGLGVMALMNGVTIVSQTLLGGNTDWSVITTGDFNGDGKTDLIWRQASTGLEVMALMNGTIIASQTLLGGNTDWSVITTGDFNGDGKTDLIWRQASTGYKVMALMNGATMTSQSFLGGNTDWSMLNLS